MLLAIFVLARVASRAPAGGPARGEAQAPPGGAVGGSAGGNGTQPQPRPAESSPGPPPQTGVQPGAASAPDGPMLAIVLDDLGWGVPGTADAMALPAPVTLAVLPGGPHSVEEADRARRAGHEVILHLPMEPLHPTGRGTAMAPGTITTSMEADEIKRLVRKHLDEVGPVPGLNNHTGSRATADLKVVEAVVEVARERGVFVIDSKTVGNSLLQAVARRQGVASGANLVFLDNDRDEAYVRSRVLAAAALARKKDAVIAIGHVNPLTVRCILEVIPEIQKMGVTLVRASDVVRALSVPASGMGDARLK
ncbi:MAG: divergent polysaccharide deacetylase family protein [Firmicutes bacterium]|nr:divergent polysaccharide deacetylase family protein [Bacillota bacterium]